MSQKDNFGSGFILGSIVGGVVGGLLGTLISKRGAIATTEKKQVRGDGEIPLEFTAEESVEMARHSLEDKIAQLNLAIDEVRQQLGSVNSNSLEQD
jgi:Na+/glutamate symporter